MIPGVALLMKLFIIYSSTINPKKTLDCFCGCMTANVIFIIPSIALNIVMTVILVSPVSTLVGNPLLYVFYGLLLPLQWMIPVSIMATILEVFVFIGFIMYHKGVKSENQAVVVEIMELKDISNGMNANGPQSHATIPSVNDRSLYPIHNSITDASYAAANNKNYTDNSYE